MLFLQLVENDLKKYFSLAISVDCAVFGFDDDDLKILLIERGEDPYDGYWALPGNLVSKDENINSAVDRVLLELTGLEDIYFDQVKTFGEVDRHPLGRVITIAYNSLVKISDYKLNPSSFANEAKWISVSKAKNLAFDHKEILNACLDKLQKSVRVKPIGFELLPKQFTLSVLQSLYEAILNVELDKRNFRKKILQMNFLKDTGILQQNVSHRPAKLFEFDENKYKMLIEKGFHFEV